MEGYGELANAIIIHAAKDYRSALRRLRKRRDNREALRAARALERFFRSGWYRRLTELDGNVLMNRLREEAAE